MAKWGGRHAQRLLVATLTEYGTRCHLCGQPGADTADHIIPRARGGTDTLDNLRPAHRACNSARQDMPLDEWRRRHRLTEDKAKPSRRWLEDTTTPPSAQ